MTRMGAHGWLFERNAMLHLHSRDTFRRLPRHTYHSLDAGSPLSTYGPLLASELPFSFSTVTTTTTEDTSVDNETSSAIRIERTFGSRFDWHVEYISVATSGCLLLLLLLPLQLPVIRGGQARTQDEDRENVESTFRKDAAGQTADADSQGMRASSM